jgi:ribosome-associated protein
MIEVSSTVKIDESEIQYDFIRASGPGGQNVNKVSSAVQLRFDAASSPGIPPEVRQRLARLAGRRMSSDGVLLIDARSHRTQEANRRAAFQRLIGLLLEASIEPKVRKKTRPSAASRTRRLRGKQQRSQTKRLRRYDPWADEEY